MEFLIILLLLVLNGIFAMYEIALVSSSKARLETLVAKGNKSARGVLKQLEEPEKFLSTIQIGITLIGIVSGAYVVWLLPTTSFLSFPSFRAQKLMHATWQ